jgi:ABC-type branched-subunit amino acid transport system substrate-binding protein
VIATQSPVNAQVTNVPQTFGAVRAAARAINADGGINGHPLEVLTCNGKADPNQEVNCATSELSSGPVAFVGNTVAANPGAVEQVLRSGDTADLAVVAVAPPQLTSPVAFPLVFLDGQFAVCVSPKFTQLVGARSGFTSVTTNDPEGQIAGNLIKASAKGQGTPLLGSVATAESAVDLSPAVSQAASYGAILQLITLSQTQAGEFLTSAKAAGHRWVYCSADGAITGNQLAAVGPAARNFYEGTGFQPLSAAGTIPELGRFVAQMKAEQAAGDNQASLKNGYNYSEAINGWLGVQAFAKVARSMTGPIDHNSFLAALRQSTVSFGGVIPTIDFGTPLTSPVPIFTRVFNARVNLVKWSVARRAFVLVNGIVLPNALATLGT